MKLTGFFYNVRVEFNPAFQVMINHVPVAEEISGVCMHSLQRPRSHLVTSSISRHSEGTVISETMARNNMLTIYLAQEY